MQAFLRYFSLRFAKGGQLSRLENTDSTKTKMFVLPSTLYYAVFSIMIEH